MSKYEHLFSDWLHIESAPRISLTATPQQLIKVHTLFPRNRKSMYPVQV